MSFTPFNAPLLAPLLGDPELTPLFSVKADLDAMIAFEAALAEAQAASGLIPKDAASAVCKACESFEPDIRAVGAASAIDGLAVPQFVKQLRAAIGEPHNVYVHVGTTSQDLIDTSLTLRLKKVLPILQGRLTDLETSLHRLLEEHGANRLMARTRMQAAIPITARDRIDAWVAPLPAHVANLEILQPNLLRLQLGGAAGTRDKLGDKASDIAEHMARALGLENPLRPWHTDRTAIAEFAGWLSLVSGTLGKIGQDIALMAQNGIGDVKLSGTGGSSAMPHKQNPVKAETLVTLARFNATLLPGLHQSLVHEQERSGASWTLEWMLLPQMVIATGAATRLALSLLESIEWIGSSTTDGPAT